jgi:hypothetical protein
MGAWAADSFSNDDALDWLFAFTEAPTVEMLRDTLDTIIAEDEYPDAPDCSEAIVAAEIIASLNGRPSAKMPDDLKDWLATDHGLDAKGLGALARKALARIIAGSELQELWDESDGKAAWHAEMKDLVARLGG